jgi:hypothetical protein
MVEPDLKFLSGQMERLIGDVASLTDEMRVLSAIVIRLDSGQSAVLAELRAIVTQVARMNDR